jgi:exodeoxyribonuclease V gamma subunit
VTVEVHVAAHPDALVALLCDLLAAPTADVFAAELVAVPTRGIERWLTQQIATGLAARGAGDGVAANIEFPRPGRLVREVLLRVPELAAATAAWEGPALVEHVLAAIDAHLGEPWLRLIERHVATPDPGANRLEAAAKIARLFTHYARRRPGMVRAWAGGTDAGPDRAPVREADVWQPRLWRIVREQIGVPSLAELLPEGLDPIRRGNVAVELPDRLAVYGLTATDPHDLQVLAALGERRTVNLFLLHPSPALWEAVAGHPAGPRRDDTTAALARHPMLASWGRDSRELQLVLAAHGLSAPAGSVPPMTSGTLLGRLQRDIGGNRAVQLDRELAARVAAGEDRSLQIHVTHGARRQVEVLRDAILHALAADPGLEPRDVVIMTPDLTTFAPLLEAAFPTAGGDGLPDLRLRIADRSPAAVNPLVRFAATVLELADSRLEAGLVRELVTRPVVQQRFGFDLDTAAAIGSVIDDSRISWGYDGSDRAAWHAGSIAARTWSRGLDRALAGVFYSDSPVRVVAGTAPLNGVEGQEAGPVGLLAAIVDRIHAARDLLGGPLRASQWADAIAAAVRLLAAPGWGEEWQLGQLRRLLAETFPAAGGPDPRLTLAEARGAVAGWTVPRPSPLHFRTGDVTVCTLAPMRSVPYRVVCLLGMDDERFPRTSRSDGDDLLRDHEVVGDFDRSAEDRQLLLDAVLAAGDHLIVTYAGRDQLTNAELPPAVPIAELEDTAAAMVGSLAGIKFAHPLQSFSRANYTPGILGLPGPFGFDPVGLAGAKAVPVPAAIADWPDWEPPEVIELSDLIAFLEHPARRFMHDRMRFVVPDRNELPDDTLPADLSALEGWALKERIIGGLAAGYEMEALLTREKAGDGLPPGVLGDDDLDDAVAAATDLWNGAVERGYDREAMQPYRGVVPLGGLAVEGTVDADPVRAHLVTLTASRIRAKQRLRAYARLVFLTALAPEVEWRAIVLGRRERGDTHVAVTLRPLGKTPADRKAAAVERLSELVALYVEGHRTPLPLPCESAYTWQRNLGRGRTAAEWATRDVWERDRYRPEAGDPAHRLLLGGLDVTDDLIASGFADYCARLWGPIIPLSTEKSL